MSNIKNKNRSTKTSASNLEEDTSTQAQPLGGARRKQPDTDDQLQQASKKFRNDNITDDNNSNNINNNNNNNIKKSFDQNYYIDLIEGEEETENKIKIIKSMLTVFKISVGNEPDKCAFVSLLVIGKRYPALFSSYELLEPLLSLLKKDPTHVQKKNNLLSILASNLLMAGYESIQDWPVYLFCAYLDDVVGDRYWVEDQYCKHFVNNLITGFPQNKVSPTTNTATIVQPPSTTTTTVNKQQTTPVKKTTQPPTTTTSTTTTTTTQSNTEESSIDTVLGEEIDQLLSTTTTTAAVPIIRNRFTQCTNEIIKYILHMIKTYITSQNQRAFIKLLSLTVGFKESRLEGSQILESLLSNANIFRFAKEYLAVLLAATTESTVEDIKTVQNLLKITVSSHIDITSTLLVNNPIYPAIALHQAIELELDTNSSTASKNATKSKLPAIFKFLPNNRGEEELAFLLKDFAARDDPSKLPHVKVIIRRVFKSLTSLNVYHLCEQLTTITQRDEQVYLLISNGNQSNNVNVPPITKERWVLNIIQMITQILFIVPTMPDYANNQNNMRMMMSAIQSCSVGWLYKLLVFGVLQSSDTLSLITKVLIFEPLGSFFLPPSLPAVESDRNAYRILCTEVPVQENVFDILLLNIANEHRAEKRIVLDICDVLLKRAISIASKFAISIPLTKVSFAEQIIMLSKIENIPMDLSYTNLFWQSSVLACLLICLSPSIIGSYYWNNCPTIRILIEMIITRSWKFPPYIPKSIGNSYYFTQIEQNARAQEKSYKHQLPDIDFMILDIKGSIRQPPDEIIERLQKMDNEYHLGFILCNCRSPDFLLDIMSNQDSKQSMMWLNPIIHNDPKTLDILPPICISEILLSTQTIDQTTPPANSIAPRVLNRMSLFFNSTSPLPTLEILNFFFTLLCSENTVIRTLAKKSLSMLVPNPKLTSTTTANNNSNGSLKSSMDKIKTGTSSPGILNGSTGISASIADGLDGNSNSGGSGGCSFITEEFQWLLKLNNLLWFEESQEIVISALKKAIQVETDIGSIRSYLQYLVNNQSTPYDASFPIDLSHLILNRSVIANYLLTSNISILIFNTFQHTLEQPQQNELAGLLSSHNSIQKSSQKWITIKSTSKTSPPSVIYLPRVVLDSIIYCISSSDSDNPQIQSIIQLLFPTSGEDLSIVNEFYEFENEKQQEPILKNIVLAKRVLQSSIKQLVSIALDPSTGLFKNVKDYIDYLFSEGIEMSSTSRSMILELLDREIVVIKTTSDDDKSTILKKIQTLELYINQLQTQHGKQFLQYLKSLIIEKDMEIKQEKVSSSSSISLFDEFLDQENNGEDDQSMKLDIDTKMSIKDQFLDTNNSNSTFNITPLLKIEDNVQLTQVIDSLTNTTSQQQPQNINIPFSISVIRILRNNKQQQQQSTKSIDSLLNIISKNSNTKLIKSSTTSTDDKVFDICKEWERFINIESFTMASPFNGIDIISRLIGIGKLCTVVVGDSNKLGEIFKSMVKLFINFDCKLLEEFIGRLFSKLYRSSSSNTIVDENSLTIVLFNCLVSLLSEFGSQTDKKHSLGMLLDWVVLFVQQFVLKNIGGSGDSINLKQIYFLLFGKDSFKFSTLLHSHFIHNSTWKNLKIMMHWLFTKQQQDIMTIVDPTLVLGFINAYHQHPRSSAPYYSASNTVTTASSKSVTNMSTIMDSMVMHYLSPSTIRMLSDYITKEIDIVKQQSALSSSVSSGSNYPSNKLLNRMNLLISSAMISRENLISLILHLSNQYTKSTSSAIVIKQIYFAFPSILKSIITNYSPSLVEPYNNNNILQQQVQQQQQQQQIQQQQQQQSSDKQSNNNNAIIINHQTTPTTQLDIILHRVILKISDMTSENRNSGFIIIRKLAILHPELVTLHLPSIYSLLSGRSDTPLAQLLSRNYHHLFYQVLDLLDILRPIVFNSQSLIPILKEYFSLFSVNCTSRIIDFIPIVSKFCDFLYAFTSNYQNLDLLISNKDTLKSLSNFYPNADPLLLRIKPNQISSSFLSSSYLSSLLSIDNSTGGGNQQQQLSNVNPLESIKSKLYLNDSNDKLIKQLEDVLKTTQNLPGYLGCLKNELLSLIQSDYSNVRSIAYFLIQRYIQYCPQDVESMMDRYLCCFKHWNPDVIKDAIQHSSDFYSLSNDRSEYLIEQILIYGGKDSISDIKKLVNPFSRIFY